MAQTSDVKRWLLTTGLSLTIAVFSWSSTEMFGSNKTRLEKFDDMFRSELTPSIRRYSLSVEVATALTDIRKNQIAVLPRLTAVHDRVNRKLSDTRYTMASPDVRHLVDSAVILATHASHQALMDSATYAGFRVRRLSEPDIALLRAAEAFKHAEAEAWRREERAWRAWKEGHYVFLDREYLATDERLDIAGRGFNAAYEQSTKTRAEDEKQQDETNTRLKRELDDTSLFYRKVAFSGALSSIILIVALSRVLSKSPKTADMTEDDARTAGSAQID